MIRKGQVGWLAKGDVLGQRAFIHSLSASPPKDLHRFARPALFVDSYLRQIHPLYSPRVRIFGPNGLGRPLPVHQMESLGKAGHVS
jgi:hypothetical protein